MRAHLSILLLVLLPAHAGAQEPPAIAGTWVPAGLRHALGGDRRQPLPCWLEVQPDLGASETCGAGAPPGSAPGTTSWGTGRSSPEHPGATTIVFAGPPPRQL